MDFVCTRQACDWCSCFGGVTLYNRALRTSPLPTWCRFQSADLWSASGLGFCLILYHTFYISFVFQIRLFTICDHRERITHPSGWSEVFGCNGGSSDIFGIPKDNSATPQDRGLAASTVIDGFRWCRLLFSSPSCRDITSLSNAQNHRHIVRCDGERYSPTIPTYSFCPHRFCRRTCRASCVICR